MSQNKQRVVFLANLLIILVAFSKTTANDLNSNLPLVINTWGFIEANKAAWSVLTQQPAGTALDALVEGCSTCERLQCDGTVGYGGSPDEAGETTLDAMIMDGANMNIGAVAGMRQIKNAIGVARYVLEHTEHTLLVGDGASDFAEMMGFKRESLATRQSREMWRTWHGAKSCQPNFWVNVIPNPNQFCGPYTPRTDSMLESRDSNREKYKIGLYNHDTIGMIVIDSNSHIYAGTSTNGARFKIPGRVGDSPIPGAGAYADNEVGAAVATGDGDVMMRFLPSLLAVEFLRSGKTPTESAFDAMRRIVKFYPKFSGGLVVADRFGNYSAACVGMETFPFSVAFKNHSRIEHVKCSVNDVNSEQAIKLN